jgi:hypothetical protein
MLRTGELRGWQVGSYSGTADALLDMGQKPNMGAEDLYSCLGLFYEQMRLILAQIINFYRNTKHK